MVYAASVTPFDDSGKIDYVQFTRLMAWFANMGIDGVVVAGTTGEGPSLSAPEKRDLALFTSRLCLPFNYGLGVLTNSLSEAKWLCKAAAEANCEFVLLMPPPFYSEVPDSGRLNWYLQVLDTTDVPVIAYNFPKRTGIVLSPEFLTELSKHPNFYGVKDSSGDASNLGTFRAAIPLARKFVGDETLLIRALTEGWTGTISGAANVVGSYLSAICNDFRSSEEFASNKHKMIIKCLESLRLAPQPFSNKEILRQLGVLTHAAVRLPLAGEGCPEIIRAIESLPFTLH